MKAKNKEVEETNENNSVILSRYFSTVRLRMTEIFQQFKTWLFESRGFSFYWFSQDKNLLQSPEDSLREIPTEIREKLVNTTEKLSINSFDQEAITSALNEALEKWLTSPESSGNSVVFLSSPVSAVSRILTESLSEWSHKQQVLIRVLSWNTRPQEAETIEQKLQQDLESEIYTDDIQKPELVVIPNLSWCFLRCVEGLDGVDYLQDLLLRDRRRFWVIASNQVAWQYLIYVCNFQAYCSRVITLPKLNGEQLQTWLEPVVDELGIRFSSPDLDIQIFDENKSNKKQYFEKLANVSGGVSIIAVQVFLNSLAYHSINKKNKREETEKEVEIESQSGILEAQNPDLPDLPFLEQKDYYLLFSLLLHGDITLLALTQSLGDEHYKVQDGIQILRRAGIVEQCNQSLQVNPIHYPNLKRRLAENNFIIDQAD